MTAVMNPFHSHNMYSTPPDSPSSRSDGSSADWKQKYYEVSDLLSETRAELDEFTKTSRELEEELERDLERTEKAQDDLRQRVAKVEGERDEWKSKYMSLQHNHNTTTNSLQRELDATRQSVQLYKAQVRELEMGNDDLERNERQATSSLVDIEQRYAKALEEKIMLEHELQDKTVVEETCQRLRDELRDAAVEVTVLKDQIEHLRHLPLRPTMLERQTSSSSSLPLVSPTGSDKESLMRTPAPDLSLSDLVTSTPVASISNSSTRSSLQSCLSLETFDEFAMARGSPTSFTSITSAKPHVTNGRSTINITPTQQNFLQRTLSPTSSTASTRLPTPRRRGPGPSPSPQPLTSPHTLTPRIPVARALQPKSKGVQMVSDMRARVRTLEQKIHSTMPRLRVTSATPGTTSTLAPRAGPPSRTGGGSAVGGVRTPTKAAIFPAIPKEPASPWVMIADDGDANTTLRQPPSPERPPQLPPMPSISPIATSTNFDSPSGIRPPSRTAFGLRSASAMGRPVVDRSITKRGSNPRNKSPLPPPTAFGTTASQRGNPARASSIGPPTAAFKPPSRIVAFVTSTAAATLDPLSPMSDGRPTTPTHLPQSTASGGLRRAHTMSSPSKPPTSGILSRQRRDSAHQTKPGIANTAQAGTTPGRTKGRAVTSPETPPPPVPSMPAAHATSKNSVLGQSRIGAPGGTALAKSRIGRPNSYGMPLAQARTAKEAPDEDTEAASQDEDETVRVKVLIGRNRAGTMI